MGRCLATGKLINKQIGSTLSIWVDFIDCQYAGGSAERKLKAHTLLTGSLCMCNCDYSFVGQGRHWASERTFYCSCLCPIDGRHADKQISCERLSLSAVDANSRHLIEFAEKDVMLSLTCIGRPERIGEGPSRTLEMGQVGHSLKSGISLFSTRSIELKLRFICLAGNSISNTDAHTVRLACDFR